MTSTDLYALITAGQSAVRAVEAYGSPETVRGLDKALCSFPVADMDETADHALHRALRAVELAEDAEEWALLADVEHQVSRFMHEPDGATWEHPAVAALVLLTSRCRYGRHSDGPAARRSWEAAPQYRAWRRAFLRGLEALRELTSAIEGSVPRRGLDKEVTSFLISVRRAIPYRALYETRQALAEAARTYGVFVIGMRQPPPLDGPWQWARRIGSATYVLRIEPLTVDGHPNGSVAVGRIAADGTAGPVRYIPLGPNMKRRRAVTEALYRI